MKKIDNPPNPFESECRELLEPAPAVHLEVFEDHAQGILSHNKSPDLAFRWSVNPYRGCVHSCIYCYARRTHEYLGFGAGTDFESKIVVKPRAAELLRAEFMKPSWKGELVLFSGVTDCYQPLEAVYRLTRKCLETCLEFQNPAGLITKSYLVTRDIDILQELSRQAYAHVFVSIPFADDEVARQVEPQAAPVARRFAAVEALARAGVPVGVSLAPVIPGLNDKDIPALLARAKDAGARCAFYSLLRLPGSVKEVFLSRLKERLPHRYERVLHRLQEARGGRLSRSGFFKRRQGEGSYWKVVEDLFHLHQKKNGLDRFTEVPEPTPFRRPGAQIELPLY
jgi:DNA repair photolyase